MSHDDKKFDTKAYLESVKKIGSTTPNIREKYFPPKPTESDDPHSESLRGALVAALVPLEALIASGETSQLASALCPSLKEAVNAAVEIGRRSLANPR